MDSAFQHLIDVVNGPLSEAVLRAALQKFTSQCGFKYFAYVSLQGPQSWGISSYPQEWQKRYQEENFVHVDPVLASVKRNPDLYRWTSDNSNSNLAREVLNFYGDAAAFGIRSGFSISIPTGYGHHAILTLASDQKKTDGIDPAHTQLAVATTAMIHMSMTQIDNPMKKDFDLSPREMTCLRWIAEGKSLQDVADLLGISYSSVRFYIDEAKRKLSATNAVQAVAIASRLRLI